MLDRARAERTRQGDREENIDRDSAWVKDMRWVQHFEDRDLIKVAEAAQFQGPDGNRSDQGKMMHQRPGRRY